MTKKYIDFEVIRQRWGKFSLKDGSVLKILFILTNLKTYVENNIQKYDATVQNIQIIYPDDKLLGPPNEEIQSIESLQTNIENRDVSFEILENPVNEYLIDNGTKLKVFPLVIKVARTSLKNNLGEPIYMVTTNVTLNYDDPKL